MLRSCIYLFIYERFSFSRAIWHEGEGTERDKDVRGNSGDFWMASLILNMKGTVTE